MHARHQIQLTKSFFKLNKFTVGSNFFNFSSQLNNTFYVKAYNKI